MAKHFKSSTLFSFLCMIVLASMGKIPWAHGLNPSSLVPSQTLLQYHHGPLLTGPKSINIYLIWYGPFSVSHKLAVSDFFASFGSSLPNRPTVSSWWKTAQAYKDASGRPVSGTVRLAGQVSDIRGSLGTNLKRAHIATLVRNAILKGVFAFDPNGVYLLLTAAHVAVERFCVGSCGYHDTVAVSPTRRVVVAHVGDSSTQCPGLCAWPFAVPMYGPPGPALIAPNGVGIDGMIMNVAAVLAGSTTNPFGKGYFQGDELAPLEAVTACAGIFGTGAYPGYAGKVLVEGRSKASYNVYGARNRLFLLPAMWDPVSLACKAVV